LAPDFIYSQQAVLVQHVLLSPVGRAEQGNVKQHRHWEKYMQLPDMTCE
jgi:hypothetical protein